MCTMSPCRRPEGKARKRWRGDSATNAGSCLSLASFRRLTRPLVLRQGAPVGAGGTSMAPLPVKAGDVHHEPNQLAVTYAVRGLRPQILAFQGGWDLSRYCKPDQGLFA